MDTSAAIHPALQEYIQCIQIIDTVVSESSAGIECQYPPTPQNSIFIYLKDLIRVKFSDQGDFISQPEAVIVGPQVSRVVIDVNRHHKAVRIGFHPAGLYRFLGIPLYELVDKSFDATDVLGTEFRLLIQRLKEESGPKEIKCLVEDYLLHKVKPLKPLMAFDLAVLKLLHVGGNLSMDSVAGFSYLSLRQFERISRERLGYSPKLFARIARFSQAYRMKEMNPQYTWTDIAYQSGYFDQMHLIKDFKVFAGVTPGIIEQELIKSPVLLQKPLRF